MKNTRAFRLVALLFSLLLWSAASQGQDKPAPASPPATATGKVGKANVTVKYSSPAVKGRKIWGELVPYGQVWRAGANEATTFSTDQPLTVEGKALPAGTYSLFAIPTDKQWTIVFNKTANQWGAFKYDEKQDALRVMVTPRKAASMNERLAYEVTGNGLVLRWENLEVPVMMK
ncbi:DUF2911 domain-containing protein [Hymenobacter busanensis]|uniref:DUF2911 domain-containing protein n=1 Tax=Hymenobacter busanensis TaxID=2607656 RepID=A0A7L4ZRQ7_9BACT|nr:DUF2911 domain-containing protein [Hymenobacter busanensis]KAA9327163.1 DUF2911 domain-containing protein [Hymenobacter busanensis]QHJ05829.1 DUF2911 domain-containing protein [Hymenobacter busanensis]